MSRKSTRKRIQAVKGQRKLKVTNLFNPFPPSVRVHMASLSKNFDFNLRRDHQKISYDRRDYESVDEKSQSLAMSRKTTKEE